MVADREIYGRGSERRDLALDEIVPRRSLVVGDRQGLRLAGGPARREHVLVEVVERAKVAEVPVERRGLRRGAGGDRRHHDVPAIARVPSHHELPGAGRRGSGGGGSRGACARARTMAESPGRIFTGLKTISELEGGPIVAPRAPGTMSDLT